LLRSCGVPPQKFGGETPPLPQAGDGRQGQRKLHAYRADFHEPGERGVGQISNLPR